MTLCIRFGGYLALFVALAVVGACLHWETTSPPDAWTLDEPVRTFTDFSTGEERDASFSLRNTAHVPLRIIGASIC